MPAMHTLARQQQGVQQENLVATFATVPAIAVVSTGTLTYPLSLLITITSAGWQAMAANNPRASQLPPKMDHH